MKKLLIATIFCCSFMISNAVFGSPFLVCDPQEGVTTYKFSIDGQEIGEYPAESDGLARIDLGLLNLADGRHSYVLEAGNVWGWSFPSDPFVDTKIVPAAPSAVFLSR